MTLAMIILWRWQWVIDGACEKIETSGANKEWLDLVDLGSMILYLNHVIGLSVVLTRLRSIHFCLLATCTCVPR